MPDVLILGAGLGGLLCGSILARHAYRVCLLEKGFQPGGALQTFVREGIRFDTGLHSVGGLGPGEPLERIFRPLGLTELPWERMEEDEVFLDGQSFPLSARRDGAFLRLSGGSAWEKEHVVLPFLQSSWRLKGGGKVLVDALVKDIEARGGSLLLRKEVVSVEEGEVLCRDGSRYSAPLVISDLHPQLTFRMVRDHVRPAYLHTLASYTNCPGVFSVQIHLKPGKLRYIRHGIFIDQTLMVHCGEADQDGYAVSLDLLRWAPKGPWDREALAKDSIALAAKRLPELPEAVGAYWTSTPATWERFTGTPDGSAYGFAKKDKEACLPTRTPLPWLYLTGQNIGLHGVLGVSETAVHTCRVILGDRFELNI